MKWILAGLLLSQLSVTLPTVSADPLAEQPDPAAVSVGAQGAAEPAVKPTTPVDVMTVLDNSGSMRTNDPKFLTREVVSAFATRLAPDSRLGIILFDENVHVALGLTDVGVPEFKEQVARSLKRVDYRGQRTDIPAGVERALYELRAHGRPEAQRMVIFLTDGIVDVGSPAKDIERARWLREDLVLEAKQLGIRIFGIALTEAADFQLIQSVAQTTGGEYFRVLAASDIPGTFERISARIEQITRAARQVTEAKQVETTAPQVPAPPVQPAPVVVQVPVPASEWSPWLLAVVVGLIVLGIVAVTATRGAKQATPTAIMSAATPYEKVIVPAATLYDRSGHSGTEKYPIKKSVTQIGRDAKTTNDVVIPQDTVSSQHAVIEFRDGSFYLRDLRSTNGTFVNGKKFSDPEVVREVVLKNRDRIRFDAYEFEFVFDALEAVQQTRLAGAAPAGGTRLRAEPPAAPIQAPEAPAPRPAEAVVAGPARGEDEPGTRLKSEMCPRHQSWKATELCPECRTAYCKSCMKEKDGRVVCVDCFEKAA